MKRRTLLAALPLLAAPANAAARLKAVATFSILADFLREVGGEDVEVASLVGPDADVHSFQPTPREARLLASASLLVSNGLGFEGWLDRLADAAAFRGQRIVASVDLPAGTNPHAWLDIAVARRYVAAIAAGLAKADPALVAHEMNDESLEVKWIPIAEVAQQKLHPSFANTWEMLKQKLIF